MPAHILKLELLRDQKSPCVRVTCRLGGLWPYGSEFRACGQKGSGSVSVVGTVVLPLASWAIPLTPAAPRTGWPRSLCYARLWIKLLVGLSDCTVDQKKKKKKSQLAFKESAALLCCLEIWPIPDIMGGIQANKDLEWNVFNYRSKGLLLGACSIPPSSLPCDLMICFPSFQLFTWFFFLVWHWFLCWYSDVDKHDHPL